MTTASHTARPRIRQVMHALALAGILATSLPAAAFAGDHRDRDRYERYDRYERDRYDRDRYDRNRYDHRDHDWREHRHDGYDRDRYDSDRRYSGYDRGRRVQIVWIRHGDHWHPNYVNGRAWRNDYCGRRGYESYTYFGRNAPRGYYDEDGYYEGRKRDNTGAIVAGVGIGLLGLAIATSGN